MNRLIPATALATALVLATITSSAAGADGGIKTVEGSDRGTFTTTMLDDTHVLTADHAVGRARHIGRYTLEASEVIDQETFEVSDGAFTLTASGDHLTGSYHGWAAGTTDPVVITYHVDGPVLGGSGRFAGVTGWLTFDGVANLATGKLCDRVSGWISGPGHGADERRPSPVTTMRPTTACRP